MVGKSYKKTVNIKELFKNLNMKKNILLLILIINCSIGYAQNNLINSDGTISNYTQRKILVEALNKESSGEIHYQMENDHLVVISKTDCGDREYGPQEIQKVAMFMSFIQLRKLINNFKNAGYDTLSNIDFKGMIFKTNIVCMLSTRRYHFKFNFDELNSFPSYMDEQELIEYVVIKNKNQNIIHVKNP